MGSMGIGLLVGRFTDGCTARVAGLIWPAGVGPAYPVTRDMGVASGRRVIPGIFVAEPLPGVQQLPGAGERPGDRRTPCWG